MKRGLGKRLEFDDDMELDYGEEEVKFELDKEEFPDFIDEIWNTEYFIIYKNNVCYIPEWIGKISTETFDGMESLEWIEVSEDNEHFVSIDGVLYDIDVTTLIRCPEGKKEITIPDSVREIKEGAFCGCNSLRSVTVEENNPFISIELRDGFIFDNGMTRLVCCLEAKTQITIPDSVTKIGASAFRGCENLTSVTIPGRVTEIGENAFEGCESLTFVTISEGVTIIKECAFSGCESLTSITIPDSVAVIGERAFSGCESLTSLTIPDSVTEIGWGAFGGCESLTSVTIPDSFTEIGDYAFGGCKSLTSVNIPNSVTKIGDRAFYDCKSLTSITIPDSVTEIGGGAFGGCESLTSVTISDSVTEIGEGAFNGCKSLTSVTIPDSVTEIGYYAFNGCESLTSVTIPDSVTEIGVYAFSSCVSLTSIMIPYSVTEIENFAFSYCKSLTSIMIPDSVTKIGESAFYDCGNLKVIKLHPDDLVVKFNYDDIASSVLKALEMIRTGEYTKEDPREATLILLFQHYLRTKDENTLSYIRSHIDLNKFMQICVSGGSGSAIEALTELDWFTPENIDRFIDLAAENEQREIMLDLIYYKEQKLGFQTPLERLSL